MNISFSTIPHKPAAGRSKARRRVALVVGMTLKLAGSVRGGFATLRDTVKGSKGERERARHDE